jgi:hypothetical protein
VRLKATHPTRPVVELSLEGLSNDSAEFYRQKAIKDSIREKGMRNPIIIDKNHELMSGGCRIQYANENGYTSIDAVVAEDFADFKRLQVEQVLSEKELIPEHVYHHILEEGS